MIQKNSFKLHRFINVVMALGLLFALAGTGTASAAVPVVDYTFTTPLFGLAAAPGGSLLVADSGYGIVELRKGQGSQVAALPGVSDVSPIGRGSMFAITGAGDPATGWRLYRVSRDEGAVAIANLLDFETTVNPDGGEIDSNPFDVQALNGGKALIADAGGNSLLIADMEGHVDWVATLPDELVSTANIKNLLGCPNVTGELAFVCFLPPMMPAQAVATSIAIGPDGAYYVGELKGFPGPTGKSRVWRIEPGTLHAKCGTDPACTVVADGFTSIVDLAFGPDGKLYVVEYDENSFLGVELGNLGFPPALAGGTVDVCDPSNWSCSEFATGLTLPIAVTVDQKGQVFAVVNNLLPSAQVVTLP